jgi:hypothetical protein
MGELPLLAGAVQLTATLLSAGVVETAVGAAGLQSEAAENVFAAPAVVAFRFDHVGAAASHAQPASTQAVATSFQTMGAP